MSNVRSGITVSLAHYVSVSTGLVFAASSWYLPQAPPSPRTAPTSRTRDFPGPTPTRPRSRTQSENVQIVRRKKKKHQPDRTIHNFRGEKSVYF